MRHCAFTEDSMAEGKPLAHFCGLIQLLDREPATLHEGAADSLSPAACGRGVVTKPTPSTVLGTLLCSGQAGLWNLYRTDVKAIRSPLLEAITLDCNVLTITDDDLLIVITQPRRPRLRETSTRPQTFCKHLTAGTIQVATEKYTSLAVPGNRPYPVIAATSARVWISTASIHGSGEVRSSSSKGNSVQPRMTCCA